MQSTTKTAAADCGQGSVHPGQGCVTVESENKCGWFCSDTQPDGQLTICLREQRAHRWSWLCRIRVQSYAHGCRLAECTLEAVHGSSRCAEPEVPGLVVLVLQLPACSVAAWFMMDRATPGDRHDDAAGMVIQGPIGWV